MPEADRTSPSELGRNSILFGDQTGILLAITMSELTYDTLMDDGGYADRVRVENKVILDELERKKKARSMAVPTDDNRVKARLREIGEPITLFGERVCRLSVRLVLHRPHSSLQAADRRDRLIYVLSQINAARGDDAMQVDDESSSDESEEEVCSIIIVIAYWSDMMRRAKNSTLLGRWNSSKREGQWRSILSPGWILIFRGWQSGAYELASSRIMQSSRTSRPAAP